MSEARAALIKFAETLKNPVKDARGNYGTFLSLPHTLDHVREPLAKVGLAVTQDVATTENGMLGVTTRIIHTSGEEIVFGPLAGEVPADWQKIGSAITYARRYALTAALGLAGDDDDGQSVTDAQRSQKRPQAAPKRQKPKEPQVHTKEEVEIAQGIADSLAAADMNEEQLREVWNKSEAVLDVATTHGTLREIIGAQVETLRKADQ